MRGRRAVRAPKAQGGFGFIPKVEGQAPVPSRKQPLTPRPLFLDPDPEEIWVRNMGLRAYLEDRNQHLALEIRRVVREVDLSKVVEQYKGGGRQPIHPAIIIGLNIYGTVLGLDSLRQLEDLAKRDAGAWWICGGTEPDHTTIAKVMSRNSAFLSSEFFTKLTGVLARALRLKAGTVAIDGTVIEAAASRFALIKREAAMAAAAEARAEAEAAPENQKLAEAAQKATEIEQAAKERAERAESTGRDGNKTCVAVSDLDSVVQPLKNVGASRPSYKPSVMADENKLIVGQHVDPSSESAAIAPMLEQHAAILGALPERALADSGYFDGPTLKALGERGIDTLVPPDSSWKKQPAPADETNAAATGADEGGGDDATCKGKNPAGASDDGQGKRKRLFGKGSFQYDEQRDAYVCPAGKLLVKIGSGREANGLPYTRYGCKDCADCPFRQKCTTSAQGRRIKRFEGDDLKEQMVRIFENPLARERFAPRRVLVEPVFADLRERQRFRRFRRRGLAGVAMEFSLQCVAYNIRRAVSLQKARQAVVLFLLARPVGGDWMPIAVAVALW